ncbi:MAG TPA: hypothetical protein DF383_07560, partial [Deltaproteobacteria bacterium]|nr:hypothetical protein [Deltaproteobacteria bacterium]
NDDQVEASEISKKEILFENVSSETEGGPMRTGDTVNLGKFPQGTRLGFYLVADGFRQGTKTYYSIDDLNPDGRRHLAMLADADREQIVLGIEDLPYESGDRDFNDILFSFTTNPKSALDDVIDGGNIPVASATPTPSQTPDPSTPPTSNPILEKPIAPENTSSLVRLEGGGRGCSLHPEAPTAADFIRAFHGGWLLLVLWGYLSFQWNFHQRTWRQIPRKIRASLSVVLARLKR